LMNVLASGAQHNSKEGSEEKTLRQITFRQQRTPEGRCPVFLQT
jgi:hypothetical protein